MSMVDLAACLLFRQESLSQQQRLLGFADDPVGFIKEILGEGCWSAQQDVAALVRDHRLVAVPSAHATGKSWILSRLILWWVLVHRPGEAIVVVAAPTQPQIRAILWRELAIAQAKVGIGVLTRDEWRIGGRLVALARKPADYTEAALQGIHARHVLVILDEAAGIPQGLWNQAETLVANSGSRLVAIGNPDDPTGAFAKACRPNSGFRVFPISAFDTPAFTGERVSEPMLEGLVSPTWVDERKERWGEKSMLYRAKVLGQFPDQAEDSLIPLSWIQRAREREVTPAGQVSLGVDVGRGSAESVIYANHGGKFRLVHADREHDTMRTAGRVIQAIREEGAAYACVDGVGVGAGVVDILRVRNQPVLDVQLGGATNDAARFANFRAEAFWAVRAMFEAGTVDIDQEDEELAEQLSLITYHLNTRGQIQIESKDQMRSAGRPSPDRADALMLSTVHPPPVEVYDPEEEEREYQAWRRRHGYGDYLGFGDW